MSAKYLAVGITSLLILLMFGTTLVGLDRLAFRDVSHFYTPLYDYVAQRGAQQWLPLWNPLDGTGMPLIGESTTAYFYPLRFVLFALPLSSDVAISWYVALHLMLAAINIFVLARLSRCRILPATIASVIYPLSGSILFLYCNPPFLVGAAWLPLVMAALLLPLPMRLANRIILGGVPMSLMILGGDPQGALHALLIAVVVTVVRLGRRHLDRKCVVALIAIPACAALLASPQIAASLAWTAQSERVDNQDSDHMLQQPEPGSKRDVAFSYSVPPWQLLEMWTPRVWGTLFPINQRLSRLIPDNDRVWTPSIYAGLLTLIALAARLWSRKFDRWSAIAVLCLLAAFGRFGLGWFVQSLTPWWHDQHGAAGGLYWWLYHGLPGYDSFRYPAKWLVPFSLSATLAAVTWLNQIRLPEWRQVRYVAGAGSIISAIVLLLSLPVAAWIDSDSFASATDRFWGPLQVDLSLQQIRLSLLQTIAVAIAIATLAHWVVRRRLSPQRGMVLLLAVTASELTIGGYSLIGRLNRQDEQRLLASTDTHGVKTIHRAPLARRQQDSTLRWLRTQNDGGWPEIWKERTHRDRLIEVEASSRRNWLARWHLADRQAVFNSMVSIRSQAIGRFWQANRLVLEEIPVEQHADYWKSVRRWLAIDGVSQSSAESTEVHTASSPPDGTLHLVKVIRLIERSSETVRVDWNWLTVETPLAVETLATRLRELHRGVRNVPLVDAGDHLSLLPAPEVTEGTEATEGRVSYRVIKQQAERLTLQIKTTAPALLSRSVLQDGFWQADYWPQNSNEATSTSAQAKSIPVHRVDALRQGVLLPAGQWIVDFRYRPTWLVWTLPIALIAWLGVLVYLLYSPMQRRRLGSA